MGWLQGSVSFRYVLGGPQSTGERGSWLQGLEMWAEVGVGLWVPLSTVGRAPHTVLALSGQVLDAQGPRYLGRSWLLGCARFLLSCLSASSRFFFKTQRTNGI